MSEDDIKKIFSKNLLHYLSIADKTQADLSRFLSVSTATVSDWCNSKKLPRMDKIQSISNWLNIENSDLIEDKKNKRALELATSEIGMVPLERDTILRTTKGKNGILVEAVPKSSLSERTQEIAKIIETLPADEQEMLLALAKRLKEKNQ